MRVVVVVQARMSSSRLPGKVLMPLAGKPALARLLQRVGRVRGAAENLVATSDHPSDDAVFAMCRAEGIRCERGSLQDVLSRYHAAAVAARADVVVRVTGDCPLIDPAIVDRCIDVYLREREHVAYASNVDERTYPDGLDVEVCAFAALDEARRTATSAFEREHVTPWIRRHKRKISMVQSVDLSHLRWTLDYPEDYDAIARIYDELDGTFSAADVYRLLLRRPELLMVTRRQPLHERPRAASLCVIRQHLEEAQ